EETRVGGQSEHCKACDRPLESPLGRPRPCSLSPEDDFMPAHPSGIRHASHHAPWLAIVLGISSIAPAQSAPTLGFVENWSGTSLSTWLGGSTYMNPGTGGYNGAGDGFLRVSTAAPANFGVKSNGPEYAGNWTAAGITQVRVWLSDLATDDPAEVHFS